MKRGIILGLFAAAVASARKPAIVRVAVCQILVIDGDREGNFRRIEYALEAARSAGASIVAFPESAILGWQNPDAHRLAYSIPGPDSDRIAALAVRYRLMISIGLDERQGERLYDSAILVDKTGQLLWKHRKLEVLPELMEPAYAQGSLEGIGVVDTRHGRIGLVICADTFVDAVARRIRELKPDLMLVPYGWAAEPDKWPEHAKRLETLVTRRAELWKCPVVGTDLVGVMMHGPWKGRTYGGASVVVDSTGRVTALLRDRDVEVRVVEIPVNHARQRRVRSR
ncbi:MAG TPA: carbon-nitrogen hydrolase family protein [Bryobacteraceae bacterium]|nr:carbon-nitrogen hydrolase family protein [Bryobacteraceae bacterium]